MKSIALTILTALACFAPAAFAQQGAVTVRVKDVTSYRLTGANQLVGEGLVVGLAGTGDRGDKKAAILAEALSNNLNAVANGAGLRADDFASGNIACVKVFAAVDEGSTVAGSMILATVAATSDKTSSLEGGILVSTELRFGPGDKTLADAGGLLVVSKAPGGVGGATKGSNVATVDARLIEDLNIPFYEYEMRDGKRMGRMTLALINPDVATANDIANKINESREILGLSGTMEEGQSAPPPIAKAEGIGRVEIQIPAKWVGDEMRFRGIIDNLSINPDVAALITINMVTGVITMTGSVRVSPGAITAAGVTITVGQNGELPAKLEGGAAATDPAVPVSAPNATFQELLNTFNLLQLSANEKAEVLFGLQRNRMLQAKVVRV